MPTKTGVRLIPFNLVTITPLANMDHAQLSFPLPIAQVIVLKNTKLTTRLINISPLQLMELIPTPLLFKPNFTRMDPSKLPSQSMKTSFHTNPVFINTLLDQCSVDMPSKLWVGVLKTELLIG